MTLPDGLVIRKSSIPGIGLGVFSETFIRRYTWFGSYDGEVVVEKNDISEYAWKVGLHCIYDLVHWILQV